MTSPNLPAADTAMEPELRDLMQHIHQRLARQQLAPGTDLTRAVAAVLAVLAERVGDPEQPGPVESTLTGLAPVPERDAVDSPSRAFGFDELLARVVARAEIPEDTAYRVTRAVFAELRRTLPQAARRNLARRLPADILAHWTAAESIARSEGAAEAAPRRGPAAPAGLQLSSPVLDRIEENVQLPPGINGAAAFSVTLCLLLLRLPAEHASTVRRALPEGLGDLLFGCTQRRDEDATQFGAADLLETLGAQLGTSRDVAERVAAAVLGATRDILPPEQVAALTPLLPKSLNALWAGGVGARVRPG